MPSGDSFTVHNDKDFEREVLTANYRHGKFSSFQRQLNMYGFRKVPDCSDRTYSHPFFRRNCPQLLKKVRRVVPGNNGSGTGSVASRARTPALPPMSGLGSGNGMGTACLGTAYPGSTAEESCGRASAEVGSGGNRMDACLPARKKTRTGVNRALPGASSFAVGGSSIGGMFARPHHDWGDDAGVLRNAAPVRQAKRSSNSVASQALLRQAPPALPPPPPPSTAAFSSPRSSAVSSGSSGNTSQHEFSSSWHHHTGLWGGVTNTFDERWTSGSSSAASSVDASSPVLLPINTSDIESRDSIPPFNLLPAETLAATVAVPAPISPTVSSAGLASSASGGGVSFGFEGMLAPVARKGGAERGLPQKTAYGTWSSGVAPSTGNGVVTRADNGGARGGICETTNDGSLQQALEFRQAIACRSSFDLGLNSDLATGRNSTTGTHASKDNPVPLSPPSTTGDATVTSAGSSIEWEIPSLGGAGWGSPGTVDSVAAAQWVALPPFHSGSGSSVGNGSSIRSPPTSVGTGGFAPPGTPSTCAGNGSGRELTQQQQPFASRSLSTLPAVESIDWALLDDGYNDDDGDASFSGLASPQGFDDVDPFCETSVSRSLAPLSPTGMSLALQSPSPALGGFSEAGTHPTALASAAGRMSTPLGDESWALGSSVSRTMFA